MFTVQYVGQRIAVLDWNDILPTYKLEGMDEVETPKVNSFVVSSMSFHISKLASARAR